MTGVNSATEVRSIDFRFTETQQMKESDLRAQLATLARGSFYKLRRWLAWLPAIPTPAAAPFDPLTLQRDVVRLRELYQRNGHLKAKVEYDVLFNEDDNLVEIAFVVTEGPALKIARLDFTGVTDSAPELPADLVPELDEYVERQRLRAVTWTEDWQRKLNDSTTRWMRNRGYPFAVAEANTVFDTTSMAAEVTVRMRPGNRARIGDIDVSGQETVPARHLERQLPIKVGEWYNGAKVEEGRAQLMQIELIRLALVRIEPQDDSTVTVGLTVSENRARVIRGELGVTSGGGLGGLADWTHRSFLGGLSTFTVAAVAQTGVLPLESPSEQEYRLSIAVFEPYVTDRRLSFGFGPFIEYHDDVRNRSWRVGMQNALIYSRGPLRSLTLGYTFSYQRILEFGFGDIDPAQFLPLLGLAPNGSVAPPNDRYEESVVTLAGSWGKLDRFANPRKGYVVRPRLSATTPFYNTIDYLLAEVGVSWFLPVKRRAGATIRADIGRVFPYGRSVSGDRDPFVALLQLRDATFTAGGSRDVRGWGTDLLGPKLPSVIPVAGAGDSTTNFTAQEYAPVGGLARAVASAQVNIPLPGFGDKLHSFFFVDGARIWSPDSRFSIPDNLAQNRFFVGTGGGVGYETLVGAVTVALGYKVNPSELDMRDPGEVMLALASGQPISSVPTDWRRRWQLHFAIGATF